jgi:hypothetical protein
MSLIRRLEQRLESLLDGVVGSVFRGQLHPSELAQRIIRQADLDGVELVHGGMRVPNRYVLAVNPADLGGEPPPPALRIELARMVEELAFERGWRLDGPAEVVVITNPAAPHGNPKCDGQFVDGPRNPWARLVGETTYEVTVNRAVIGRNPDADVAIGGEHVSRRHAMMWRQDDRVLVQDLGSSNGTRVDGVLLDQKPTEVSLPCTLAFGDVGFLLQWSE